MPAHLTAFLFIAGIAAAILPVLRGVMTPGLMSAADFDRRRNAWILITCVAFLSANFWIYAIACALIVRRAARNDSNPLAFFCFILFAMPSASKLIPGIGPIEYLVPVSHEKILELMILLPAATAARRAPESRAQGLLLPDVLLLAYLIYIAACMILQESAAYSVRAVIFLYIETGLVFYVASRSVLTVKRLREIAAAFVCSMTIVAAIALAESLKSWWIYEELIRAFGLHGAGYFTRGDLNLLRAKASLGHPIVLGFAAAISLMLLHAFFTSVGEARHRLFLLAALVTALLVPFSRGPWFGALAGIAYLIVAGPRKGRRIGIFLMTLPGVALFLGMTPFGRDIYKMLPYINDEATKGGSIVYREMLWDASMRVLKQNFWFGDTNYLSNPILESMRQGEGIIDMVNSYLQFALSYGVIGAGLFVLTAVACFFAASVRKIAGGASATEELQAGSRALKAAMAVTAVTIATCSFIEFIPVITWMVLGLCAGMPRITAREAGALTARSVNASKLNSDTRLEQSA